MTNEFDSIAKITRPGAANIIPRERLFHVLDKGREKSVLWLSAQAGSGKTSLITSWLESRKIPCIWYQIDGGDADLASFFYYLGQAEAHMNRRKEKLLPLFTPEYCLEAHLFARRFFEELCQRMSQPLQSSNHIHGYPILVLDNYQEIPINSPFHDMLQHGITALPEGMTVVIISRGEPPSQFSRLRANRCISLLGWSDLRFTLHESEELLYQYGVDDKQQELAQSLYLKTDGWAAGLILMKESVIPHSSATCLSGNHAQQEMFDYFANEIFQRTPPEVQRFLLSTAFCPSLTSAMAEQLTGLTEAGSLLARLSRNHYFTDWRPGNTPVYQYHPLFQDFLRNRAQDFFTKEELSGILQTSSALLLEAHLEADAVELLAIAHNYTGIANIITVSAQHLIEQGRNRTVLQWLSHLPQEFLMSDPWLLYWQGTSLHPFELLCGEQSYSHAFHLFLQRNDKVGALLAWSGMSMSIIAEWKDFSRLDQQIRWLTPEIEQQVDELSDDLKARICGLILLSFSFRQPEHRNVVQYDQRAESLLRHGTLKPEVLLTLGSYLLLHYTKMGFLDKAWILLEILEPRSTRKDGDICQQMVLWRMLSASCHALTADKKGCLEGIDRAMLLADSSGMHVYDIFMLFYGALAGFIDDDQCIVDTYFKRISAAQHASGLIHPIVYRQILGWKHIFDGNYQIALEHVEAALELTSSQGAPIEISINAIVRAQLLFMLGRHEEAHRCLEDVARGNAVFSAYIRYMLGCTQAWFDFNGGNEASGVQGLRETMQLGKQHRILMHHFWTPRIMTTLCSRALEADIEPEYVRELIMRHKLVPEQTPCRDDNWPWSLKIYALGRFEIVRQGERLVFSRKKQEKPLSLLKALVIQGGKEVNADWLCDILWPSATGDSARSSLKMTLSRLRRLLGDDQLIEVREGKLTLNPAKCWVDAWDFNDSVKMIDTLISRWQSTDAGQSNMQHVKEPRTGQSPIELRKQELQQLTVLMNRVTHLYAGEFLHGERTDFWEIGCRNRLQQTFWGCIKRYGACLEQERQWDRALACYYKALETDALTEEMYQRLISCHLQLGQKSEAVRIYQLCRTTLLSALGVTPSRQTEELFVSATKDSFF